MALEPGDLSHLEGRFDGFVAPHPSADCLTAAPHSPRKVQTSQNHGGSGMKHLLARITAVVVLAVGVGIVLPEPATGLESTLVRVWHTAPERSVAGEILALEADVELVCALGSRCSDPQVTVTYTDPYGSTKQSTAYGSGPGRQTLRVFIPSYDVAWPTFSYTVTGAAREEYVSADSSLSAPGFSTRWVGTRIPESGLFSTPLYHQIRVQYLRADGSPAASVPVLVTPSLGGEGWTTQTDLSGRLVFDVPGGEWLTSRALDAKYTEIDLRAFDSWPASGVSANPTVISGNGNLRRVTLSLGEPHLPAVADDTQNQSLQLGPVSWWFKPSTASEECDSSWWGLVRSCREFEQEYSPVFIKGIRNYGGGVEMWAGQGKYCNNVSTTSAFYVRNGGGDADWLSSENKITTEKQRQACQGPFGNCGPNQNCVLQPEWTFARYSTSACGWDSCIFGEELRPYQWTGGVSAATTPGRHDQYSEERKDSYARLAAPFSTQGGKGVTHTYSANLGTNWTLPANVTTGFYRESASSTYTGLTWHYADETDITAYDRPPFYYLYVEGGLKDPNGPNVFPADAPGQTWTHRSLVPIEPFNCEIGALNVCNDGT